MTAYPWLATALLLLVVWVLRSASLAASAAGDRRRLRGAKWYDPVLYLVGAPWHAVRSIPGTLLLALWSLGLAMAAALICYAVAASVEAHPVRDRPGARGVALARPGRLPGARPGVAGGQPALGAAPARWLAAEAIVLAAIGALGFLAAHDGPDWAPDDTAPLSQLDLDAARPFGG